MTQLLELSVHEVNVLIMLPNHACAYQATKSEASQPGPGAAAAGSGWDSARLM